MNNSLFWIYRSTVLDYRNLVRSVFFIHSFIYIFIHSFIKHKKENRTKPKVDLILKFLLPCSYGDYPPNKIPLYEISQLISLLTSTLKEKLSNYASNQCPNKSASELEVRKWHCWCFLCIVKAVTDFSNWPFTYICVWIYLYISVFWLNHYTIIYLFIYYHFPLL